MPNVWLEYRWLTEAGSLDITCEAMQRLKAQPFPGNVRELENEVRRMVALAEDGEFLNVRLMAPEFVRLAPQSLDAAHAAAPKRQGDLKEKGETLETYLVAQSLLRNKQS